jgi:hypothetical protein
MTAGEINAERMRREALRCTAERAYTTIPPLRDRVLMLALGVLVGVFIVNLGGWL